MTAQKKVRTPRMVFKSVKEERNGNTRCPTCTLVLAPDVERGVRHPMKAEVVHASSSSVTSSDAANAKYNGSRSNEECNVSQTFASPLLANFYLQRSNAMSGNHERMSQTFNAS